MNSTDLKSVFVVFDLDDTLYPERDYQRSGFEEICSRIKELYQLDLSSDCAEWIKAGDADVLDKLCERAGLSTRTKESLLWLYRLHRPRLALHHEVRSVIETLEVESAGVAILTDGRSISQRSKVQALGLGRLPTYVSEEIGCSKPHVSGFRRIERDFPANRYVYVADNPAKDFVAPKTLGWRTIGIKGSARNIHPQECDALDSAYLPDVWVHSFSGLLKVMH